MADPILSYHNYGNSIKARVINLDDQQLVFPVDDDNDIVIVNEDVNGNIIDETVLMEEPLVGESATMSEENK